MKSKTLLTESDTYDGLYYMLNEYVVACLHSHVSTICQGQKFAHLKRLSDIIRKYDPAFRFHFANQSITVEQFNGLMDGSWDYGTGGAEIKAAITKCGLSIAKARQELLVIQKRIVDVEKVVFVIPRELVAGENERIHEQLKKLNISFSIMPINRVRPLMKGVSFVGTGQTKIVDFSLSTLPETIQTKIKKSEDLGEHEIEQVLNAVKLTEMPSLKIKIQIHWSDIVQLLLNESFLDAEVEPIISHEVRHFIQFFDPDLENHSIQGKNIISDISNREGLKNSEKTAAAFYDMITSPPELDADTKAIETLLRQGNPPEEAIIKLISKRYGTNENASDIGEARLRAYISRLVSRYNEVHKDKKIDLDEQQVFNRLVLAFHSDDEPDVLGEDIDVKTFNMLFEAISGCEDEEVENAFSGSALFLNNITGAVFSGYPDACTDTEVELQERILSNLTPKPSDVILKPETSPKEEGWVPQVLRYEESGYYYMVPDKTNIVESLGGFIKGAALAGAMGASALMGTDAEAKGSNSARPTFVMDSHANADQTDNQTLMAEVLFAEALGETAAGKAAVASVIVNRTKSTGLYGNFPKTIHGVIYQRNAFSCIGEQSRLWKIVKAKKFDKLQQKLYNECYEIAGKVLKGEQLVPDIIAYRTIKSKQRGDGEKYFKHWEEVGNIGSHVFYRVRPKK